MAEKASLRLFIGIGIMVGLLAHCQEVKGSNTAAGTGQLQIVFKMFNGNSTVVKH
jgi:hypothetical protein